MPNLEQKKRRSLHFGVGVIGLCLLVAGGAFLAVNRRVPGSRGLRKHHEDLQTAPHGGRENQTVDQSAVTENVHNWEQQVQAAEHSGNVADLVDVNAAFNDFRAEAAPRVPTRLKNVARIMRVDTERFGESDNPIIQHLVGSYNENRMRVQRFETEGTCSFRAEGACSWPGGRSEHRLEFVRDGFRVMQSCLPGNGEIHNGVAMYYGEWDEHIVDTYYLLPLTVFDPAEFVGVEAASIKVMTDTADEKQMAAWKVRSEARTLYFGKEDMRLYRVVLKEGDGSIRSVQADFRWPSTEEGVFPLCTRVALTGKVLADCDDITTLVMELNVNVDSMEYDVK